MHEGTLTAEPSSERNREAKLTLAAMCRLLGVNHLDGDERSLTRLLEMTQEIVEQLGVEWVRRHRQWLLAEWRKLLA